SVIDGRADLYSLGVTAFFALTGRLPFDSQNPAALMAMHSAEPAPPVRSVSRVVPARLAEAVDRCLAKDPAARYPSGEALAEAVASSSVMRDANIEYELARAKYLANRFSSIWARAIFLAAAAPVVVLFPRAVAELIRAGVSLEGLGILLYLLLTSSAETFILGMASAPKRTIATPTRA